MICDPGHPVHPSGEEQTFGLNWAWSCGPKGSPWLARIAHVVPVPSPSVLVLTPHTLRLPVPYPMLGRPSPPLPLLVVAPHTLRFPVPSPMLDRPSSPLPLPLPLPLVTYSLRGTVLEWMLGPMIPSLPGSESRHRRCEQYLQLPPSSFLTEAGSPVQSCAQTAALAL